MPAALLAPELVKEKEYDPGQPRDSHGRWSKIGEALSAISDLWGMDAERHETFGGPEGRSDSQGLIAFHGRDEETLVGEYTLNLHDADIGTSGVISMNDDELAELEYGLTQAMDALRENTDAEGEAVDPFGRWKVAYGSEGIILYANIDGDEDIEEVLLSLDDAESLIEASGRARSPADPNDPSATAALESGASFAGPRKRLGGQDDQFIGVVAPVDTPAGRRVRLGAISQGDDGIKGWRGGRGKTTVELDERTAAEVSAALEEFRKEGKRRQEIYDDMLADALEDQENGEDIDWVSFDSDIRNEIDAPPRAEEHASDAWEDDYRSKVIETPWGSVRLTDVGMNDEANAHKWHVRLEAWPAGMTAEQYDAGNPDHAEWAWPGSQWEKPRADLTDKDVKALIKVLRDAFAADVPKFVLAIAKMADGQPRDDDGRWARYAGITELAKDVLTAEYGDVLEIHSWSTGDPDDPDGVTRGWTSLHDDGSFVLSYDEAGDGVPVALMDDGAPSWAWHRLPDDLRTAADWSREGAGDEGDDPTVITQEDYGDQVYSVQVFEDGSLEFDVGTTGWAFEDPDQADQLADRVEELLEWREAWENGEYDEEDEDEEDEEDEDEGEEEDGDLDKAAGKDGKDLEDYWKRGKGRAKWVGKPHPWTALRNKLRKHMPQAMANRVASQWFKDVHGYWPGSRKGDNPVGPG